MHLHPDFVCFLKCLRPGKPLPQVAARQKRKGSSGREGNRADWGQKTDETMKAPNILFWGARTAKVDLPECQVSIDHLNSLNYMLNFMWYIYIYIYIYIVWFLCIVSGFLLVFYVMFLYFPCFPILILIHTWYIFTVHIQDVICPYVVISINNIPKTPWILRTPPTKSYPSSHNHGSGKLVPSILVSLSFKVIFHFHNYGRKGFVLSPAALRSSRSSSGGPTGTSHHREDARVWDTLGRTENQHVSH